MSQMERTWPDKEKNMKLHFFSFSPLFLIFSTFFHFIHFVKICEYGELIQSTNRRCPEKPQNRTYPRSEFWKFHPKFCYRVYFQKFKIIIFRSNFWNFPRRNSKWFFFKILSLEKSDARFFLFSHHHSANFRRNFHFWVEISSFSQKCWSKNFGKFRTQNKYFWSLYRNVC